MISESPAARNLRDVNRLGVKMNRQAELVSNVGMRHATAVLLTFLAVLPVACGDNIEIEKAVKVTDVHTGWYDAGIVNQVQNKLVPSVSLKLQNVSSQPVKSVQINAIFRRVNEAEAWGEHFVRAIGSDAPLAPGATGTDLVLRSSLGYTGDDARLKMLQHREFVDAKVEIFAKHGSRTWQKLGEYTIDRRLLTQ